MNSYILKKKREVEDRLKVIKRKRLAYCNFTYRNDGSVSIADSVDGSLSCIVHLDKREARALQRFLNDVFGED